MDCPQRSQPQPQPISVIIQRSYIMIFGAKRFFASFFNARSMVSPAVLVTVVDHTLNMCCALRLQLGVTVVCLCARVARYIDHDLHITDFIFFSSLSLVSQWIFLLLATSRFDSERKLFHQFVMTHR